MPIYWPQINLGIKSKHKWRDISLLSLVTFAWAEKPIPLTLCEWMNQLAGLLAFNPLTDGPMQQPDYDRLRIFHLPVIGEVI